MNAPDGQPDGADHWWLSALAAELRQRGVRPDSVVAEAAAHLRDSGQDPFSVFGAPGDYATAVADSLGTQPAAPAVTGPVVVGRSMGPTVAGQSAAPKPAWRLSAPGVVRLRARGIGKRYGRRQVLRNVGFDVRAGQIAAIVGANGAGKSTLLRICAGLESPDTGDIVLDGRLGYCPQHGGTADFLLPEEHFVLVGAGHGMSRRQSREDGRAWLARLGWRSPHGQLARQLSGGTRQKLNLAMSTLTQPDVLLLDEPYQGFDRGTYVTFWDELWRLRDAGKAIVVVTHLLNQLDRVDLVVDLTEGQVEPADPAATPNGQRRAGPPPGGYEATSPGSNARPGVSDTAREARSRGREQ